MTRKTTAQWRREHPAYDLAYRAVEALRATQRLPHTVAHIHPDTHHVSIILHGTQAHTSIADGLLYDFGIPAGSWRQETGYGVQYWRKRVTA